MNPRTPKGADLESAAFDLARPPPPPLLMGGRDFKTLFHLVGDSPVSK